MNVVFRNRHLSLVDYYREVLEGAGIRTFVKNRVLDSALSGAGDTIVDWWPLLCVVDPDDYDRARELIAEMERRAEDDVLEHDWNCPHCGQEVPKNFAECWRCGRERVVGRQDAASTGV